MQLKELYNGEIVSKGPFSKSGFYKIMESLFSEKKLEQDKVLPIDFECIPGNNGDDYFHDKIWRIKGGGWVEYCLNAYTPYLGDQEPHLSVTILGSKEKISEIEKIINQTIKKQEIKKLIQVLKTLLLYRKG
ncbi:hypothetical protein AYK26_01955 [Euryarchaeota archaeon SM23-78]|nr:MAG: hypothetical protein AYK26_01955 [Euryarchaeota archaeon SM23-78]MBW3000318.1 hypothetical protein [Candidatus Woesearchaeota archaeon]